MNQIYVYDGPFEKGDKGWALIREAASRYGGELDLPYDFEGADIARTEKGKPFFTEIPVEFSLSHSGAMWICLFADKQCGLDLQLVETNRDWEAICRRHYTVEEQHYVELWGVEGFYDIWVRKEAFGKCTGLGFFSEMPSMVDENTDLKKTIEQNGQIYCFEDLVIAPEVKCAYCVAGVEKASAELRILG